MLQLKNYQVHIENEQIDEQAIQINESFLSIAGKRFHHVWLRDHCLCSQCYRTGAFQKLFHISDRLFLHLISIRNNLPPFPDQSPYCWINLATNAVHPV